VATRIEQDGTMQRRVVDTARRNDGPQWEDLAARALASMPLYRPVPGTAVYHISVDDQKVQVGEYDLDGPLRDLVTVVLAMGDELLARQGLANPTIPAESPRHGRMIAGGVAEDRTGRRLRSPEPRP
jgi:hypothetical protein